ncbi:MAG: OmpA family protein, partial [Prevotella sp.]|nr:OmpA family protein [Prevotella sp.]
MKKLFLILAAAMMTASVSAQKTTVTANKTWDNWYIGFNAGVATPMNKYEWLDAGAFKGFAPTVGVRVGKNLTTVFGLALDANVFMGSADKSLLNTKTFIDAMNLDLMASFNLMNAFAGYKGEPRTFEISALVGGGWSHFFGVRKMNTLQAKAALDFAFNLGAKKAWQFYIEPAVIYGLKTWGGYDG